MLHNKRGRDSERPVHHAEEWPQLATTRESPRTETKTQHSQKKKRDRPSWWPLSFSPPRGCWLFRQLHTIVAKQPAGSVGGLLLKPEICSFSCNLPVVKCGQSTHVLKFERSQANAPWASNSPETPVCDSAQAVTALLLLPFCPFQINT